MMSRCCSIRRCWGVFATGPCSLRTNKSWCRWTTERAYHHFRKLSVPIALQWLWRWKCDGMRSYVPRPDVPVRQVFHRRSADRFNGTASVQGQGTLHRCRSFVCVSVTLFCTCVPQAGLASLLSPELFHTSPWASISLHSWNDGCAGAAVVKCESNTNSPHSQCDCNRGGVYSHAVGVALDIFFIIDAAEAAALSTKAQSQLLSAAGTAEGDRAAVSGSSCRIPPDAWRNTSTYRFNQASNYKVEYSHAGHSHVTSFRVDATRVAFDSR